MFRLAIAMLTICISGQALGYGYVTAKVVGVRIDQTGRGMVMFEQPLAGTPAGCRHGAYANALAFDSNIPAGKAIMAMALAAKATGDSVAAIGLGTCSIYGGSWVEDWDYGVVQ